jgi:hypothetical protein
VQFKCLGQHYIETCDEIDAAHEKKNGSHLLKDIKLLAAAHCEILKLKEVGHTSLSTCTHRVVAIESRHALTISTYVIG